MLKLFPNSDLLEEDSIGTPEQLEIYLYDKEKPSDCLGKVMIPVALARGKPIAKWYKLAPKKQGDKTSPGELSLELHTTFVNK